MCYSYKLSGPPVQDMRTMQELFNMCGETRDLPKEGETWYIRGDGYVIEGFGYAYFDTNGDANARYITMHAMDGTRYIITEKAFGEKATKVAPVKNILVTPAQILRAKPCEAGVTALARTIGVVDGEAPAWLCVQALYDKGCMNTAYKASELNDWYVKTFEVSAPTAYLNFLAKACGLIPKGVDGMDRATLKRLLGIRSK